MTRRLLVLLIPLILAAACTFYPVVPQAEYEARLTAQAEAVLPTVTPAPPEATATEVVVEATMEATPAPECLIKGNINRQGEKIYHVPGSASYDRTIVDPEHGEMWFCTEEDAVAAGFRKALH